jgi:alpha-amylase
MPDLNLDSAMVTEQMLDVAGFWLADMGVDGFRLDAVRHLIEEGGQYDGTEATHQWLAGWDEALTVGEVWDDTSAVVPYVADGEVDIAFEFTLAGSILSSVRAGDPDR